MLVDILTNFNHLKNACLDDPCAWIFVYDLFKLVLLIGIE